MTISQCYPVFRLPKLGSAKSCCRRRLNPPWCPRLQIKENSTQIGLNCNANLLFLGHLTEEFKGVSTSGIELRLGLWFHFSWCYSYLFSLSSDFYHIVTKCYSSAWWHHHITQHPKKESASSSRCNINSLSFIRNRQNEVRHTPLKNVHSSSRNGVGVSLS